MITRTYTDSEYDHVAMILKMSEDPNEIFIIDATGNNGVAICTWPTLWDHIGSTKYYKKLVYRHVDFDRSPEAISKLDKFLK